MRFPRILALGVLFPVLAITACNRGSRPSQTGKAAPDFTLADGTTRVHLTDYRGQVVLLNFWATWCSPCIQEMPSLLQLHHELPSVAVIAVSVDEDGEAYKNFIARRHIDFITVRDANETVPKLFNSDMWPETFVIDRKGVIRRKFVGAQDWNSPEIRNFLKNL